ncbi:MAG: lipopolysaccharide biosynthesis protein [Anaerocolumna sp.]|jgi:PST family polysaccharide transporter|nr:lipopolysaccharide biosynthesis protein [Anaerocolumna sp.]
MLNNTELKGKMVKATKWAAITEISAKIISPITNMILARLLIPEAFGVVATVTMIISFAEMFTDAGFQKYLVQHEFKSEEEKYINTNVAFWTNFLISIFLWGGIAIFSESIATLVSNPGLGVVIAVACIQLPLSAFSSIQMALYKRDFDFKTLFLVRIIAVFTPFAITIPLAFFGFSYWSLIIGTICGQISNAIVLMRKSKWKPIWFYDFKVLREMISFSIWSLVEAISIWLTTWVDVFIIGSALDAYYLGIYKTSTAIVTSLMSLITSVTVPILFSTLSRLQNDNEQFNLMFFKTQRLVSIVLFPLGVGIYLYSELATLILLGNKWNEASVVIGQWALTSAIMIVFGYYCSEVYRAKGRPKLSFLAQALHLVVLIPVCIISSKYGFLILVYTRSWIRMQFVLVHFLIMKFALGIPISKMIRNVFPTAVSAVLMGCIGYLLQQLKGGMAWDFLSIAICVFFYFGFLLFFSNMRKEIFSMLSKFRG